jgi:hypothetical protein
MFASKLWTIKYRALIPEKTFDLSQGTTWKQPKNDYQDGNERHPSGVSASEGLSDEATKGSELAVRYTLGDD